MDHEEYLSDASLIEDDEEEIDLPDDITKSSPMEHIEDEGEQEELSDAEFYGFEDHEIPPRNGKDEVDIEMDEDLTAPFPADMKNCIRWYPGTLPAYDVKFATEPVLADLPTQTPTLSAEEDHIKIKPLKIKKTNLGNFSTPSPFLQRESREWKPSSQFFKPLNQGLTLFLKSLNGFSNLLFSRLGARSYLRQKRRWQPLFESKRGDLSCTSVVWIQKGLFQISF